MRLTSKNGVTPTIPNVIVDNVGVKENSPRSPTVKLKPAKAMT